jgi:hypothetical protein
MCSPEDFSVENYNRFEEKIWNLKKELDLKDSPFLFLPEPAEEADYLMMNASGDGLSEPDMESSKKYLDMMGQAYEKLKKLLES